LAPHTFHSDTPQEICLPFPMDCITSGNKAKGIFPLQDIKLMLQHNLMATPSIFAITTSYRCGSQPDQIDYLLRELSTWDVNYCFEKIIAGKYHGSGGGIMGVVILKLHEKPKDKSKKCIKTLRTGYLNYPEFERDIKEARSRKQASFNLKGTAFLKPSS
jgi:hypothetical protein